MSSTMFRMPNQPGHKFLFGMDGRVFWKSLELSFEAIYRLNGDRKETDESGFFVQGVVPVYKKLFGIARYELYHGFRDKTAKRTLLGLTYRPHFPISYKLEYNWGNNAQLAPDGWQLSIAILF